MTHPISPDSTQYKFQYAIDMWNEFNCDGCHELADADELRTAVSTTRNAHQKHLSKTISIWKDSAGRLQYTVKG